MTSGADLTFKLSAPPQTTTNAIRIEPSPSMQVSQSHVFDAPLLPTRAPFDAESLALIETLESFRQRTLRDDFSGVESFLRDFPDSAWALSLRSILGGEYYRTGHFSKAIASWKSAWELGRGFNEEVPMALAEEAVAELGLMYARLGRMQEIRQVLAEVDGRQFRGRASVNIQGARDGLWSMEHRPEVSFRCGPLALDRICAATDRAKAGNPLILDSQSTTNGFSARQVAELSRRLGMNYQVAFRERGAAVVLPAVVHWKVGHYAALIARDGLLLRSEDPTFQNKTWLSDATLDEEASGYFLVNSGPLPTGWRKVSDNEADRVLGKGTTNSSNPDSNTPYDEQARCGGAEGGGGSDRFGGTGAGGAGGGGGGGGMPRWNAHLLLVSQTIEDTPVGYTPPVGPPIYFTVTYNSVNAEGLVGVRHSNVSPDWRCNWLAYVTDDPMNPAGDVRFAVDGGGTLTYTDYNSTNQVFKNLLRNRANLVRTSTSSYEVRYPDGSKKVFGYAFDSVGTQRKIFMTAVVDPAGNAATIQYDDAARITSITDAIGQQTRLYYEITNTTIFPQYRWVQHYLITRVVDPFGRTARFRPGAAVFPHLRNIVDSLGLSSSFQETAKNNVGWWISEMTTPYGTTRFVAGATNRTRWLEVTEPDGATERIEYSENDKVGIGFAEPFAIVPAGMPTWNRFLYARNTYHWDKKAFAEGYATNDFTKARIYHFTHGQDINSADGLLESVKMPFENRVWFNYPDQNLPTVPGIGDRPTRIGRVLDDGTTQLQQFERNSLGSVTRSIDPVGRTLSFIYATNEMDLLEVRQTRAGKNELLARATYDSRHLPLSTTDAAGQTTVFSYNSRGQLLSVTNAKNEVVSFTYDANGYLLAVDGPLPGPQDRSLFTYDPMGRLRTVTDPESYTLIFDYDVFDRLLKVTFPDATWREITYDRLGPSVVRDRLGRETRYTYNSVRQLASVEDALGRVTRFDWCKCGDLDSVIDALGRATTWHRDIQGRVIAKEYADGSKVSFEYEKTTSRLRQIRDEQNQLTQFTYNLDDSLAEKRYVDAIHPTPTVRFIYDADYPRVLSMQDGNGMTAFSYHPVPSAGAVRLASIDGPWANDTITFSYDELGRVISRAINNVAIRHRFDSAGRLQQITNNLGVFDLTWEAGSRRLSGMRYPNGQATEYAYHPNARDPLLQRITHRLPNNTILSEFTYGFNAHTQMTNWTQLQGGTTQAWTPTYDTAHRLLGVAVSQGGSTVQTFHYSYDDANNRTSELINGVPRLFDHNALNQLTAISTGVPVGVGYEWDATHRLIAISNGTHRTEFSYDGFGRRTRVVEKENGTVLTDRRHLWCATELCEERDGTGGTVRNRLYRQGEQIVASDAGLPAGNCFYSRDHLASVREAVSQGGGVMAQTRYDPYGRANLLAGTVGQALGFCGLVNHTPSGLSLAWFREYDPTLGRWLSRDPIEEAGGINLYAYVEGDPLNRRDPHGTDWDWTPSPWDSIGGGIGAIAAAGEWGRLPVSLLLAESFPVAAVSSGGVLGAGLFGFGFGTAYDTFLQWASGSSFGQELYDTMESYELLRNAAWDFARRKVDSWRCSR